MGGSDARNDGFVPSVHVGEEELRGSVAGAGGDVWHRGEDLFGVRAVGGRGRYGGSLLDFEAGWMAFESSKGLKEAME